jgi:hypothetical protein
MCRVAVRLRRYDDLLRSAQRRARIACVENDAPMVRALSWILAMQRSLPMSAFGIAGRP